MKLVNYHVFKQMNFKKQVWINKEQRKGKLQNIILVPSPHLKILLTEFAFPMFNWLTFHLCIDRIHVQHIKASIQLSVSSCQS